MNKKDSDQPKLPTFELREAQEVPVAPIEDLKPDTVENPKKSKLTKVLGILLALSVVALVVVTYLMLGFQKEFKTVNSRVADLTKEFVGANQENKALEEKSLALEKELQVLRMVSQEKIALEKELKDLKDTNSKLDSSYKSLSDNYKKLYTIYEKQKTQLSTKKVVKPKVIKK